MEHERIRSKKARDENLQPTSIEGRIQHVAFKDSDVSRPWLSGRSCAGGRWKSGKAGCNCHNTTGSLVVQIRRLRPVATAARDVERTLRVGVADVVVGAGGRSDALGFARRAINE